MTVPLRQLITIQNVNLFSEVRRFVFVIFVWENLHLDNFLTHTILKMQFFTLCTCDYSNKNLKQRGVLGFFKGCFICLNKRLRDKLFIDLRKR